MGLAEDQYSLSALMGAAGRVGDAAAVQAAFDRAWTMGLRTTYLCNTAMNNLARAKRPDLVWRIRDSMDCERLQQDRFTVSAVMKAAGSEGDAEKLKQLYVAACRLDAGPDGYVYSDLFNSAAQCPAPDPAWLLEVQQDCSICYISNSLRTVSSRARMTMTVAVKSMTTLLQSTA